MADERPEGMSEQDWTNFQSRYRSDPNAMAAQRTAAGGQNPAGTPGAAPSPTGSGTPGVPGTVDPALKNPAPSPTPALQPSPSPQIGLGNTQDAQSSQPTIGGGLQRVQADGLLAAGQQPSAQPQNPAQQMQSQLRTSIMGLLNTDANNISVKDADLAPQSQAFAAAQERYGAKRRAELALQASRGGWGNSGGFDQRADAITEGIGQAVGANDAALIGQKMDARRQQLQQGIAAASQLGMADEANNLQRQLANLNAQVQTRGQDIDQRGQNLQNNLANLDASTRIYLGDLNAQMQREGYSTQERLARMDAELKRQGIDLQGRLGDLDAALRNRQIDLGYDTLGLDAAKTQAGLNRDALLAGLQG